MERSQKGTLEAAHLKLLRAVLPILALTLASCGEPPATATTNLKPRAQASLIVWTGQAGAAWVALKARDSEPELRGRMAKTEGRMLGLPEGRALYRAIVCNFSQDRSFEIPSGLASEDARFTSLPAEPPQQENARLLWRALGGARGPISLSPGRCAQLILVGPLEELADEAIVLRVGEEIALRSSRVAPDEWEQLERNPYKAFFQRGGGGEAKR